MRSNQLGFVGKFFLVGWSILLLSCNPESETSPPGTMQSEPSVEFDDGGETIEI